MTIVAAADGSALGNPGPSGWAWYVDDACWRAGGWPHGTNNQGELMAVLDLFRSTAHRADEPLLILCDSQYVINCVSKWMPGWKRKGWRKADGKAVLNVDLLKDIDAAIRGRNYSFEWVKGHAGHDLNEAADVRARAAATAYQNGTQPPSGPGFPGAAPAGATPTGAEPAGAVQAELEEPDLFSTLEDFSVDELSEPDRLVALERELQDPRTRADAGRLAVLLDPDFEEIGVSGRMWSRDAILSELAGNPELDGTLELLNVDLFAKDTALLTYRSTDGRGTALRSSLWRRASGQWRIRFHQATPEA
jgi:ribonuclease HI